MVTAGYFHYLRDAPRRVAVGYLGMIPYQEDTFSWRKICSPDADSLKNLILAQQRQVMKASMQEQAEFIYLFTRVV